MDLFGDKWSLVVLRTIFAGRHRYGQLMDISEGISSNILADRLEKLESLGLLRKSRYQTNPARFEYRLTLAGADLLPVLQQLAIWAHKHVPDRWELPGWFADGSPDEFYPSEADERT